MKFLVFILYLLAIISAVTGAHFIFNSPNVNKQLSKFGYWLMFITCVFVSCAIICIHL